MNVEKLIEQLRQSEHETYAVASKGDTATTEAALGCPLPGAFKAFVQTFSNGAYLYMLQEVSAVGEGNAQIAAIQNIYRPNCDPDEVVPFREGGQVSFRSLIPFGLDSNGNQWCFISDDGESNNDYPVAYFDSTGRKLYGRLSGFTEWLSVLIDHEDEVIRTLYDEDVLHDELELG